ncbi:MAG: hypothetical protein E6J27_02245 [Chloroflexi bacterium]|nr:MAG: hypothetical protein E6J27_02245 [Chloroflexota bacterium]
MTRVTDARHLIGLSFVLSAYWVPVVMGIAWGVWLGGDPISIGQGIGLSVSQGWLEFPIRTLPLAPLVIGGAGIAALQLLRRAPRPRTEIVADKLAVALAVPYVAILLYAAAFYVYFIIACRLAPRGCSLIL